MSIGVGSTLQNNITGEGGIKNQNSMCKKKKINYYLKMDIKYTFL